MLYSGHSTRGNMTDRSRNLDEYVNYVRRKLRSDSDNMIVIAGEEGSGKSNLALLLCNAISHETFRIEEHLAHDAAGWIDMVKDAPRYGSILADEGGEIFMSNDANTIEGKNIKKALQQARRKNLNLVFLAPRHNYLNKTAMYRAHSYFYTYQKVNRGAISRGYGIKWNPSTAIWQDGKRPWFDVGFYFRFPSVADVDPEAWDAYLKIKNRAGDERLDGYAEQIRERNAPKRTIDAESLADLIEDMAFGEQQMLLNTRGRFDRDMIYNRFQELGTTIRVAKEASMILNDRLIRA